MPAVLVCALVFCTLAAIGSSDPYWNWRNPLPQGNDYNGVAYGNGRFVAVGRAGTITTSTDGITWVATNSGVTADLGTVAFGNGRFVVFGNGLTGLLTSDDGLSWAVSTVPLPALWNRVTCVTFAGDRFFAMSNQFFTASLGQNFVATSSNGINWSVNGSASTANVGRVAFNAGVYVAQDASTGDVSSPDGVTWNVSEAKTLHSTDGFTWTAGGGTGLASIIAGPLYFNGRWVVAGVLVTQSGGATQFYNALSTSTDAGGIWTIQWQSAGQAWHDFNMDSGAVFGSRLYVASEDWNAQIMSTSDFTTFRNDFHQPPIQFKAAAVSADRIVVVGRFGQIVSSADGTTWTSPTTSTVTGALRAAAFGNGQWIVAGDSGLAGSADGITWRMLPGTSTFDGAAVAYGNGIFIAGSIDGRIGISSDKGATWTLSGTHTVLEHIAFANGRFVASHGLISSTDGQTWSPAIPVGSSAGHWLGVFTVDDVFYAVGTTDPAQEKDGVIARSTDGLSWTIVATMPELVSCVGGKGSMMAACGYMGEIWTSADGLTWTRVNGRPLLSYGGVASLLWVGDSFVGATYFGQIVLSADGITWSKDDFASSGLMFALAPGNGQVLAVGYGGVIWEVGAARFTSQPVSRTVPVGAPVTFSVSGVGKEPLAYQWHKNGAAIGGATSRTLRIQAVQAADAGNYSAVVSNSGGSSTSSAAALVVNQNPTPPSITSQPQSQTVSPGDSVTFSVAATGDDPLTYQWQNKNGPILGARSASYTIASASPSDAGAYIVVVSNPQGTATSTNAILTVNGPPAASLVNIATRAYATTDNGVTIGGFVISGSAPKQVLLRAVGPSLASQGLGASEVLADPMIELHHGSDPVVTNDNWGDNTNAAAIASTAVRVGATALDASDTKSAALLTTLTPGVYTFIAKGKNNTSGIVLLEVYDADSGASTFVNIATRARCTTNNGVAIGGFVISGTAAKQVLLRAVGPSLASQGLSATEVLADPVIELHHGSDPVVTNDNWGDNTNTAAIVNAASRVGATPLAQGDTKSSALLTTLQPGVYSFVVRGKNNTSGLVLVEVYDAD